MKKHTSMEMKLLSTLNPEIEMQNLVFLFFLPQFVAIINMLSFFTWGIIDPIVFQNEPLSTYGIFGLSNGFLCFFVWVLIGLIVSIVVFFVLKMVMSYFVLRILYMREFLNNSNANQFHMPNNTDK